MYLNLNPSAVLLSLETCFSCRVAIGWLCDRVYRCRWLPVRDPQARYLLEGIEASDRVPIEGSEERGLR